MNKSNAIIRIQGVHKSFAQKEALQGIDLIVPQGEIYGLIGNNGAGKTTTLRLVLGLLKPDMGVCQVFDENPYRFRTRTKKRIGAILDDTHLTEELSALDNLVFWGGLYGMKRSEVEKKFIAYRSLLELEDTKEQKVGTYSKGMKQKLAIIRELIHEPELLVLDEPFIGLDPNARIFLREFLKGLNKKGMTILVSSHDLYDLEMISHKVTMIRNGTAFKSDVNVEELRSKNAKLEDFFDI